MKTAIVGALGQMGRMCTRVFSEEGEKISFLVDTYGECESAPLYRSLFDATEDCDCVVDFSSPSALDGLLEYAVSRKKCTVIATTGYTSAQLSQIRTAAASVPIFLSGNMSLCISIAGRLCKMLASALCPDFAVEIVETHHSKKRDAPSGTALYLADKVRDGGGGEKYIYDRRAKGMRQNGEIGIHSLRGGSVVGKHEICFLGAGESIILTHVAEDRELFARGALSAARFILQKEAGLYKMEDLALEMMKKESE